MQQNKSVLHRAIWIAHGLDWLASLIRFAERTGGNILDLVIRLWLAQIFFVSGIIKVSNWQNALSLSQHEYPVSWMNPVTAAYLGVSIELLGALLLALGLATRFAAFSMLVLAAVIQFNYQAFDMHLFWIALFGWYLVRGAGAISLDHFFVRGLGDSAIPFAANGIQILAWVKQHVFPFYQLALRVWLALAIYYASHHIILYAQLLPIAGAAHFAVSASILIVILLLLGLATRWLALSLFLGATAMQMHNIQFSPDIYWQMVFALLAFHGAGHGSLDGWINNYFKRIYPQLEGKPAFSLQGLPRVVIVGAGFGGVTCAVKLAHTAVQVTLVDRHNYHLFQPLLYQVATAALAPGDIAEPVRGLFRENFNTRVLLGDVQGIDAKKQELILDNQRLPYDYLVLATGASHSYFGRDDWAPFAPGLKSVEDATEVRRRLLTAFELAEACDDPIERASLLTFLIVGGGPTGVELAGSIAELAHFGMEKEFRNFDPASARVLLVQSGERLLPTFPESLSVVTKQSLEKIGVEVLLNSRVEHIDAVGVTVSGKQIASRTVLWAAGVVASPAAKWLNAEADKAGRIKVAADLSVMGHANIFAVGDTALANAWNGEPVPGLAPAAKQGGIYVAKLIRAKVEGSKLPAAFKYQHLGSLATIGRKSAVADFGFIKLSGTLAWWLWGFIHVSFLVGLRNRVSVMFDWFWAYLTFKSGSRLITGSESQPPTIK
ncbi:MAG: FAD-dependent oxidoreductase [Methylophilaceae bacterium]